MRSHDALHHQAVATAPAWSRPRRLAVPAVPALPEPASEPLSPAELAELTARLAGDLDPTPGELPGRARAVPLLRTPAVEAWLLRWPVGLVTPAHDHGPSTVALTVVEGALSEECLDPTIWTTGRRTTWRGGSTTLFPLGHVHLLGAARDRPAAAVHAWSPPRPAGSAVREPWPGQRRR